MTPELFFIPRPSPPASLDSWLGLGVKQRAREEEKEGGEEKRRESSRRKKNETQKNNDGMKDGAEAVRSQKSNRAGESSANIRT